MKLYKSLFMTVLAAVAFTSCSDEGYWEKADLQSVPTYSFAQASNTYSLSGTDALPQVAVEVYRNNENGNVTVPVSVTLSDETVMSVDAPAVTFEDGKSVAEFIIKIDESKIQIGKNYIANLAFVPDSVDLFEENLSISGNSTFKLTFSKAYSWTAAGTALYTEDMVGTFFGVENLTYEVAVEKAIGNSAVIRLVDPYGAAYPYNAPGDYDTSKKHYMEINFEDPEGVYIPSRHYSGMNWGYGEFIFFSMAGYYIEKGNSVEAVKGAGYCGTLVDNVITFPAGTLLVGMADYNGGGLYAGGTGAFKIDLSNADLSE